MMKFCNKCKKELPVTLFGKRSDTKSGLIHICRDCKNKEGREFYRKNTHKIFLKHKAYVALNREKTNERKREYYKKPQYRLADLLRKGLYGALQRNDKRGKAIDDLGCSIQYFKNYIAKKFQKGMTWNNWGEWHLDHIVPLSSVDLTNKGNYRTLAHYINIQPLWSKDNIRKGNR